MKTLYLDCGMGAAGDMLTAALLELLPDGDAFLAELNALGIPGVEVIKETTVKCGITGTHISVKINGAEELTHCGHEHYKHQHTHHNHSEHSHDHGHTHTHRSMEEISLIIEQLRLPEKVHQDVLAVYKLIAEAESKAHAVPVGEIHFHEVGTMDAIADVTAVCLLMDRLSPDEIIVSPVHVGSGQVKCAHGILPVPAPATAYILQDVPIYGGSVNGELCTPTGAALLKYFADKFGNMPVMKTTAIGYGMGKKNFERANCVRAMLGQTADAGDVVTELSCNIDDMTPEAIGFAMDRLFECGALEVFTVPIGMKKSRPGTLLCVMCSEPDKAQILSSLFKHTTTIGVRETTLQRHILKRRIETLDTPVGPVRCKHSEGYGVKRSKYEYEDLASLAKEKNCSLEEVRRLIEDN